MAIYLDGTWYLIGKQDFELETFLTMKYDKNGHIIGRHELNKKLADKWPGLEVGWTTWFVRIKRDHNEN